MTHPRFTSMTIGLRVSLAAVTALALTLGGTSRVALAVPNVVYFQLDNPIGQNTTFEADLVVDRIGAANDSNQQINFTSAEGFDVVGRVYTTQGFVDTLNQPGAVGLPDTAFFPATAFHPAFQLQYPRWGANANWANAHENARVFTGTVTGDSFVVDVADRAYTRIHLVTAATEGEAALVIQVTYTDTTFETLNRTVPDWTATITPTLETYYLAQGVTAVLTDTTEVPGSPVNLYGVSWVPDPGKAVDSFFVQVSGLGGNSGTGPIPPGAKIAFFGAFGETGTAPEFAAALPAGTYGSPYSANSLAVAGVPTATVELLDGGLPGGLDLAVSGVVSGTPTAAGVSGFTLRADNGITSTASIARTFALTINRAPLTATVDALTRTYGSPNPALTFAATGLVLADTVGSVFSGQPATTATVTTPVGAYPIVTGTLSATSNYSLTVVPGTLTISPAPLTVTAEPVTRTYGSPNPALPFTVSGLVAGDTLATAVSGALTTTATISAPVGTYTITQGSLSAPNYAIRYIGAPLTITRAPLVVTAVDQVMQVGGPVPTLTVSYGGFVLGDTAATALTGSPACTTTATSSSPAGVYPITCTLGSLSSANYAFTFVNGALQVADRPYLLYLPLISNDR